MYTSSSLRVSFQNMSPADILDMVKIPYSQNSWQDCAYQEDIENNLNVQCFNEFWCMHKL